MAIVYSYPLNDDIRLLDELVGTTKKSINGDIRTVTRNFLLSDLTDFFISTGGIQKTITLTTNNTSGPATLNQLTGVLNIPDYSTGISVIPAALTKVNDTNVTLTLGGSPSNALLQGVSLTLGWTGTLADSRISSASVWNAKEPTITPGTVSQYWRGDKTWQTFPSIPTVGTWGALNYPTWTIGAPFVKMTAAGTFSLDTTIYEPTLGNPTINGYVLSSTTAGVRSWVAQTGGGGSQNLQQVTDIGASTTNGIIISKNNTPLNGVTSTLVGWDWLSDEITTRAIEGTNANVNSNSGLIEGTGVFGQGSVGVWGVGDDTSNGGIGVYAEGGFAGMYSIGIQTGIITESNNGTALFTVSSDGINASLNLGSTSKGLVINSGVSSTGNTIEINKGAVNKLTVNQEGEFSIVKIPGGLSTQYLMADGSTTTGGGGSSPLTTKGDLYTFSTVDARLPIGTDGQILTANSGVPEGLSWQDNYADWTSTVKHIVKNNGLSGTITKGTAVYVTSSDGTNMLVGRASNVSEPTSSKTMGLMQSNITTTGGTQTGFVITEGLLGGLNTAGTTAGDPVWLGVNGALIYGLINKPYAPNHLVFIGIVTKVSAGSGEIFVKVQNGFELKELHDVQAQSPALKDTLYYDNTVTPAQWKTASIQTILGITTLSGSNTGDQDLQQVTTKGSLTTVPININVYNDTEGVIGLVVASDDITGSSTGADITGSSLGADITGGSNGIVVSGPEAVVIYDSNYGVSVVNPGSIAFTTYIQSGDAAVFNLGTSARGLVINSGTSSVGNVVEIVKEDITKLIINQEGELTATKIIKEGGGSTEYLMADGSVSGGGSIQQSLSGTGMTATGGTLPTGTNTHFYRWSQVGDLITVRINLQFQTAGTCSGIAIPFANMPDIPQIPQHPNIYATALDMITFGSGSLATNKSIGTFTVGSGMSGIRIKTIGTPNTYEIVVGRASGSYNNGWIHVQYYI